MCVLLRSPVERVEKDPDYDVPVLLQQLRVLGRTSSLRKSRDQDGRREVVRLVIVRSFRLVLS